MESTLREYNSQRKRNFGVGIILLPDRYFHICLPIVTKHELGLPFPSRNLPIKFCTNPSTIFLVIVVTDRHADTQTNAGKNILPRFRGENDVRWGKHGRYDVCCSEVVCGYPGDIDHGYVSLSSYFTYDNTAIYNCWRGYLLVNTRPLVCSANGTWVGQRPHCQCNENLLFTHQNISH